MRSQIATPRSRPGTKAEEYTAVPMPVGVYETKDEFVVTADLPGVLEEQLTVKLEDHALTVKGTALRNDPRLALRALGAAFTYDRTFGLGNGVDENKISAKLNDGVLTIRIGKTPDSKTLPEK